MFYERYVLLCNEKGVSPSRAALNNGISKTSVTRWKDGAMPNSEILSKLSKYFSVSLDYMLGKTDIKNKPTAKSDELTERQKRYLDKIDRMTPAQLEMLEVFMNGLEKSDQ